MNKNNEKEYLYGFIDTTGRLVSEIEGVKRYSVYDRKTGEFIEKTAWEGKTQFAEDLAAIKKDDQYGFIDRAGRMAIEPRFIEAGFFSEGLAPVRRPGGKWEYIDKTGKAVFQQQFELAYEFSEGFAVVKNDGRYGFIDHQGQWLALSFRKGHTDRLRAVAFSPDGKLIASGSDDKTVKLFNADTGTLIRTFTGHTDYVWSVDFSPDGKTLLSCSDDRTIRLWEVVTGNVSMICKGHNGNVRAAAFSPDGRWIASGGGDKTIRLWDVSAGKSIRVFGSLLTGHSKPIQTLAFSPDGSYLASGSHDRTIKIWEAATGKLVRTLKGHAEEIYALTFSPDGSIIASGGEDGLHLWDFHTGTIVKSFRGRVWAIAFSPDGRFLASGGGHDKAVNMKEVASGRLVYSMTGHSEWVSSLAFSPDGKMLASGGIDKSIIVWDTVTGQMIYRIEGQTAESVEDPLMEDAHSFSEGLAAVKITGKWGFIDTKGNVVITPSFDKVGSFSEGLAVIVNLDLVNRKRFEAVQLFPGSGDETLEEYEYRHNQYSEARKKVADSIRDKYGYINTKGEIVIPPQFDEAHDFSEGLARFNQGGVYNHEKSLTGGMWGFIDKDGQVAIPPQFDEVFQDFSGGLAGIIISAKRYYQTQFLQALENEDFIQLKTLPLNGIDINQKDSRGYTALEKAIIKGDLEMVRLLIENGADLNANNESGNSPLHLALEEKEIEIVKLLIMRGADIQQEDRWGKTVIEKAVITGREELVSLLLEKGADINK
ncbi:MAG: WG repeat-containing protein [Firmicutes bacterium]|nr:WG repeat-containing protein [Bacillota bacterium]